MTQVETTMYDLLSLLIEFSAAQALCG
jgi:hypothetical protein